MQHSNDDHYPESSPKPSPRGLRHEKEAFLPPDRRVDMLPPTRDDAPCRIRYSDGSPTSIDVGSFERPYYARAGIGMGRASGVWEACRSMEQLLLILRRLARLFAVERSIYSDLQ